MANAAVRREEVWFSGIMEGKRSGRCYVRCEVFTQTAASVDERFECVGGERFHQTSCSGEETTRGGLESCRAFCSDGDDQGAATGGSGSPGDEAGQFEAGQKLIQRDGTEVKRIGQRGDGDCFGRVTMEAGEKAEAGFGEAGMGEFRTKRVRERVAGFQQFAQSAAAALVGRAAGGVERFLREESGRCGGHAAHTSRGVKEPE